MFLLPHKEEQTAEDILQGAYDFLVNRRHWIKGRLYDSGGRACLIGALRSVSNYDWSYDPNEASKAVRYLAASCRRYTANHPDPYFREMLVYLPKLCTASSKYRYAVAIHDVSSIESFNDDALVTHDMVLAVLKDALHLAKVLNGRITAETLAPLEKEPEEIEEPLPVKELVGV